MSMLPHPRGYVCYRARGPLSLNGKLDDPAWKVVPWTDYFGDIEGDIRPKPRYQTRAKMLWDDQYFYIGADLHDPHVWATLTQRDSVIFHDNDFEVFIDPDGDNHQYYEIEINALNTVWDLRLVKPYRDGGPALNEWDVEGLKTQVHVDGTLNDPRDIDRGWSVEMAFPWKALAEFANRPCPPRDGDQWRVNFSRVEWQIDTSRGKYVKVPNTKEDNWVWSPQGVVDMHRPERWGYVQFSTGKPGTVKFKHDTSLPARDLLMEVYWAQKTFFEKNKRWAGSLGELDFKFTTSKEIVEPPQISTTSEGYYATVTLKRSLGRSERWMVRQDSRLTRQ